VPIYQYILIDMQLPTALNSLVNVGILIGSAAALFTILLSFNIFLSVTLLWAANFIGCVYSYYVYHFGITMNDQLMMSMLFFRESNDITSSFDWTIFLYVPLWFIPSCMVTTWLFRRFKCPIKPTILSLPSLTQVYKQCGKIVASVVILMCWVTFVYFATDINLTVYRLRTVAEQMLPSYFIARKTNIQLMKYSMQHIQLQGYENHHFQRSISPTTKKPLIVVMVIGEALRSDRLGANGYTRNTTPQMQKIQHLFTFKDVFSCATTTAVSLPCMLTDEHQDGWVTRMTHQQYTPKFSVAKVFRDLNFHVVWLSSANKDYGLYIHKDFHAAHEVYLSSDLRKQYLSKSGEFGDILLVNAINPEVSKNTLYVLGTMGSHRDYFTRYTKEFSKFQPDLGNSTQALNNAYDNTVLYFDYFMASLVRKLKDQNALMVYVSDHGESLGEQGVFLHGANIETAPKEQRRVPMIIWMSDSFIEGHPILYKNLKLHYNQHQQGKLAVRHDHLFYSLLGCSGIKSQQQHLQKKLNLCGKWI
jgi:glucan phosphoethanolaminetransferase (alkaline phosphatase superfamily)